jgi:hypothetical protein
MPTYRAGTATIPNLSSLVVVTMSSAMPNANYTVTVTSGGTSGSQNCLVVPAISRTIIAFTVSNLQCNNGAPAPVTSDLLIFWIAVQPN